jgi:phosphoglycerate dehydrogenase-like enzyme
MSYHAHLTFTPADDVLAHLRAALDEAVTLSFGDEVPQQTRALVAGRPTLNQLRTPDQLEILLIPFAGLPTITQERLTHFPGIAVHNIHHNGAVTAELAIGLMIACARMIIPAHNTFRTGDWSPRFTGRETAIMLNGKTALIVGYGEIGQRVGAVCRALGMTTWGVRRQVSDAPDVFTSADLPRLLPEADVVLVTLPGTPTTDGLLGASELALLPPRAILVNVGRAAAVDEQALYEALRAGRLHAAALDVWYSYPPDEASYSYHYPASYPFWELDNVIMSPHRGGGLHNVAVEYARMDGIAAALNAAARGASVPHRVNLSAGY